MSSLTMTPAPIPTRIDKHSPSELLLSWNTGESFALPFFELRYQCPCASCVDEHTGRRVLQRSQVQADVRPVGVQLVGRYAVQIQWSDGHATGMYHFDRLHDLCVRQGLKLS